jgi:tetratricopeptide (TPR) repeat protein
LYAYRCAISADHRHYNGWYGLGQVYEKLGKYDVAEKHYKSAFQINPTNPVLIGCIGTVSAHLSISFGWRTDTKQGTRKDEEASGCARTVRACVRFGSEVRLRSTRKREESTSVDEPSPAERGFGRAGSLEGSCTRLRKRAFHAR